MKIIERISSPYNEVDVWKTDTGIDFEVAGGTHATWDHDRILTDYVWDAIAAGILLREKAPPRNLLMLGLGGGTTLRQLKHFVPNMRITALEIDEAMVDLARRHMGLDALNINVVIGDAYEYIKTCDKRFDAIVDDIFLGGEVDIIRPQPHEPSLMKQFCQRLNPGGILLANLVTGGSHRKMQMQTRHAFKESFETVRSVRPMKGFNEVLVGGSIAPKARLNEFESKLHHPRDVLAWKAMKVRTLT